MRYTKELARALAQNYPEDQIWLLSDQHFSVPSPAPANLMKGERPRSAAERRWWLWGLEREMMRRGVEVFHGTDFSVPYLSRRPSILTLHDLSPWSDQWAASVRVQKRVPLLLRARIPAIVLTPSDAVRRAAIARFGLDPSRVVAVPHAASSHFRFLDTPQAERPYFLFVGTLEPRKNIHRLIEAWKEVRRTEPIDLVLAGRARPDFHVPEEPGLRVLGEIPEADLPALYSGAAAVVYPSLYEGFGLPVLEAMQCGATVIASRDPAIMEVSGGAALHVDALDVRALAEAMRARPARRKESLQRAAQFSWASTARKTREVYAAAQRIFRK
jgi:glycosyltransferase involved in cell wall biosynthesis